MRSERSRCWSSTRAARVRPERLDRHAGGVGARVPARAVQRPRGRPARAVTATRRRRTALDERDFTWLDGERLIRFGAGAARRCPCAARGARVRRLRAAHHAAGGGAPCWPSAPRSSRTCRDGRSRRPQPPCGAVEGRPLVALGGGRVVDAAKAIAGADALAGGRGADHALGRGDDALPPDAGGREGVPGSCGPALVICRSGADGVPADAGSRRPAR